MCVSLLHEPYSRVYTKPGVTRQRCMFNSIPYKPHIPLLDMSVHRESIVHTHRCAVPGTRDEDLSLQRPLAGSSTSRDIRIRLRRRPEHSGRRCSRATQIFAFLSFRLPAEAGTWFGISLFTLAFFASLRERILFHSSSLSLFISWLTHTGKNQMPIG